MQCPSLALVFAACALFAACSKGCDRDRPRAESGAARADASPATASDGGACPRFSSAHVVGRVQDDALLELSGIAASRKNAGVLWVHNDSGNPERLYALAIDGHLLGSFDVLGAGCVDWEDIAIGPGPELKESYLYVADVGTNVTPRDVIVVYRVPEPSVRKNQPPAQAELAGAIAFELSYPDGKAHDSETLMVDPLNGDVYLVSKPLVGASEVYRAKAPLQAGRHALEHVLSLNLGRTNTRGSGLATGGDISSGGDLIAIRTYTNAYVWIRPSGATIADALQSPPCEVPVANEPQGEAIGFAPNGQGYYTVSEGLSQPIRFFERQ